MQILKIMITVFLIFAFLFLPFILDVGVVFPLKAKKGYFSIRLYGIIPILSGYLELLKDGLCVHLTKNKAIIFPYKKIFDIKTTIKPIKDFQIIKFNLNIDVGSSDNDFLPLYLANVLSFASNVVGKALKERKNYLNFNTDVNIYNYDTFNLYLSGKVMFNVLIIILEILRFILEKIVNVFRFQKQ